MLFCQLKNIFRDLENISSLLELYLHDYTISRNHDAKLSGVTHVEDSNLNWKFGYESKQMLKNSVLPNLLQWPCAVLYHL